MPIPLVKHPFFYVSSFGATATQWLAMALSTHPEIVCFHGTRSMPPRALGIEDVDPETFVEGLRHCGRACQYKKIFGAIHGYHELKAYEAVTSTGGTFAAIIRHPIRRIHSLFALVMQRDYHYTKPDIYRYAEASHLLYQPKLKSFGRYTVWTTPIDHWFTWAVEGTLAGDAAYFSHLDEDHIFQMERFVSEPAYFRQLVRTLTQDSVDAPPDYLTKVFELGATHQHSPARMNWRQIYEQWSPKFKFMYHYFIHQHGELTLHRKYAAYGYTLPDPIPLDRFCTSPIPTPTESGQTPHAATPPTIPATT